MKKRKKIFVMLIAIACVFAMSPVGVFTATTEAKTASTISANVKFTASTPSGFDMVDKTITATSDLAETYYPDSSANEPTNAVSVLDVIIAAHILKYGSAFTPSTASNYMDVKISSGDTYITNAFGHTNYCIVYKNNVGINDASKDKVTSGATVKLCSFSDSDTSCSALFSRFNKEVYSAKAGKTFYVTMNAVGSDPDTYKSVEITPNTCTMQKVDPLTGMFTAMSGKTDSHGIASIKFNTVGSYYISAAGTVSYTGWSGKTTGDIMAPIAKVKVGLSAPASVKVSQKGDKAVKISWKNVTAAKNYKVYRSTKKSGHYKCIKTLSNTSFTSKGLKNDIKYYFKIKAYSGKINSNYSKIVFAKVR